MQIRILSQENPLEESTATHSSSLFLGESHGQRSLAGYGPQGCKESDMTEATEHTSTSTEQPKGPERNVKGRNTKDETLTVPEGVGKATQKRRY